MLRQLFDFLLQILDVYLVLFFLLLQFFDDGNIGLLFFLFVFFKVFPKLFYFLILLSLLSHIGLHLVLIIVQQRLYLIILALQMLHLLLVLLNQLSIFFAFAFEFKQNFLLSFELV